MPTLHPLVDAIIAICVSGALILGFLDFTHAASNSLRLATAAQGQVVISQHALQLQFTTQRSPYGPPPKVSVPHQARPHHAHKSKQVCAIPHRISVRHR